MNQLINPIKAGLKSRRGKEAGAMVVCIFSAAVGWRELEKGAQFGNVVVTLSLIWNCAHSWLTGRWLPSRTERNMTMSDIYGAAKAGRLPRSRDSALERVISLGGLSFLLMFLYWLFSGAWLR